MTTQLTREQFEQHLSECGESEDQPDHVDQNGEVTIETWDQGFDSIVKVSQNGKPIEYYTTA